MLKPSVLFTSTILKSKSPCAVLGHSVWCKTFCDDQKAKLLRVTQSRKLTKAKWETAGSFLQNVLLTMGALKMTAFQITAGGKTERGGWLWPEWEGSHTSFSLLSQWKAVHVPTCIYQNTVIFLLADTGWYCVFVFIFSLCLWTDFHRESITTIQDAVTELCSVLSCRHPCYAAYSLQSWVLWRLIEMSKQQWWNMKNYRLVVY